MSDPLTDFLTQAQQVPAYLNINLSEADTRVYLIDPVLHALGYASVGDIRREVPVPATKEFLDYELYADGKAQAIVEAKALRNAVTDQAAGQCVQYAAILGVRWCIITNGVAWVVYNAHATGPLSEKKVATVRMDGDEASLLDAWDVLSLFSKQSLAQANPLTRLLAERVIMDELNRLDSPAVAALRKAVRDRFGERVTAQTVVDVIEKMRGRSSTDSQSTAEGSEIHPAELPTPAVVDASTPRTRKPRQEVLKPDGTRVTTEDLVAAGLIPSDAVLEGHSHSGVTYAARLRGPGVDVAGENYHNLSTAAAAVQGVPSANGWTFWSYQGVALAELRQRLVDILAVPRQATAG